MYVCLCKGVTDSTIRRAVRHGIGDFRSLRQQTGVASQCGKCACTAREIFRDAQSELAPRAPTVPLFHSPRNAATA